MSTEQTKSIEQQLADALAENQALKRKAEGATPVGGSLSCKVSPKGAISIYGMGKWPITLYKSQLARLVEAMPKLQEFAKAHDSELTVKPVSIVK